MKRNLSRYFLILFTFNLFTSPVHAQSRIEPWSESLFIQIETEYGIEAVERLRYIHNLIQFNQNKPDREKLEIVNDALNKFPWISDRELWDADDYWATPFETLTKFGGDCEDMAIGKYVALRLMGIPKKNLYLGYVKIAATGQDHMILVWSNDDRTETLVLDNLEKTIRSGRDRKDLLPILLTDADENIILLNNAKGERSIKLEISGKKLKKLESIKKSILGNNEKYQKYNDNRPLYVR